MASHKRTPKSVLEAPVSTPIVVAPVLGATRWERRHGIPLMDGRSRGTRNTPFRGSVATAVAGHLKDTRRRS